MTGARPWTSRRGAKGRLSLRRVWCEVKGQGQRSSHFQPIAYVRCSHISRDHYPHFIVKEIKVVQGHRKSQEGAELGLVFGVLALQLLVTTSCPAPIPFLLLLTDGPSRRGGQALLIFTQSNQAQRYTRHGAAPQ